MQHGQYDFMVAGAGFAGAVCAQQLAEAGKTVLVIDKRPHIAGNAYDTRNEQGNLIHVYGPHIFHTNSQYVFDYLSRFTDWRFYEHRVLAQVAGQLLPIPINRTTLNKLYGLDLDEAGAVAHYEKVRTPRHPIKTSEDVVLNTVGPDLCDKFFRGYTQKQWGLDLSELAAGVAARIPTRSNDDDRYFSDTYQYMPERGYTAMFEAMLNHPNIHIRLGEIEGDFERCRASEKFGHLVYTGPLDAYYGHRFGALPYRSLRFAHQSIPLDEEGAHLQPVGTINFPNDHAYTRTTEFAHLTGETGSHAALVSEYPTAEGDPYYPIPRPENQALFDRYDALARQEEGVTFVGRLAQYRYYNMDQVVAAALKTAAGLIEKK